MSKRFNIMSGAEAVLLVIFCSVIPVASVALYLVTGSLGDNGDTAWMLIALIILGVPMFWLHGQRADELHASGMAQEQVARELSPFFRRSHHVNAS